MLLIFIHLFVPCVCIAIGVWIGSNSSTNTRCSPSIAHDLALVKPLKLYEIQHIISSMPARRDRDGRQVDQRKCDVIGLVNWVVEYGATDYRGAYNARKNLLKLQSNRSNR